MPERPRFFLLNPSRRPKIRIPGDYPQKPADANWSKEVIAHDFIMPPTPEQSSQLSASTVEAINTVNNKVLPVFFRFDYQAKVYQNRFYWVQYTFVIGVFITTLLGALTVTAIPSQNTDASLTQATNQTVSTVAADNPTLAKVFGALAAFAGVITGFATMIRNREKPQEQWYKYRRWAESLRTHYFEYLTFVPPYDGPDRTEKLTGAVQDLRVEERNWQRTIH